MDKMNQAFQAHLKKKQFAVKMTEVSDQWHYAGQLELSAVHKVSFTISLSKGEQYAVAQIVYSNIAYIKPEDDKLDWLETINHLNREQGIFYYFCLDADDKLFARYVTEVSRDIDYLFHILVQGPALIKQTVEKLEKRYGKFVILN